MAENTTKTEKQEAPKVEIIRGRMPVAIVALIRFSDSEESTSALAAKYRTTVGKVDDIRKNRNFAYVDQDFKPTADQIEAAKAYIDQLEGENIGSIMDALEDLGEASDGGEAFEAKRASMRKSTKKSKSETPEEESQDVEEEADLDELTE